MTNYSNGRAREYEVRDLFRFNGYYAIRTAGSHSPADIIAWKHGELILAQVKPPGKATIDSAARVHLLEWSADGYAIPLVVCRPAARKPYEYRQLTGPGPKDWRPWTPDWAVTP